MDLINSKNTTTLNTCYALFFASLERRAKKDFLARLSSEARNSA